MNKKIYSIDTLQEKAKDMAFTSLFELFPVNFSWVDRNGYILGCNQKTMDFHQIESSSDIIGKHICEICHPRAWENTQKVLLSGNYVIFDEEHRHSDGTVSYFLSIKSPITSLTGKVEGAVNIAIDVTYRKLLEIELSILKNTKKVPTKGETVVYTYY